MSDPSLALIPKYQTFQDQMLKRDGWRCQICVTSTDLHVHHLKSPCSLGDDAIENLITLCAKCRATFQRQAPSYTKIIYNRGLAKTNAQS